VGVVGREWPVADLTRARRTDHPPPRRAGGAAAAGAAPRLSEERDAVGTALLGAANAQ
jgi:hypothetical protein